MTLCLILLKIVLFGIGNYFKKCVNGSGGFLTGSSLGIGPTGTWRRCLYFLKVVLHVLLVQTFGAFFSAVSVGLSLSQNDHLFFIEINCYFKIAINYSHMF